MIFLEPESPDRAILIGSICGLALSDSSPLHVQVGGNMNMFFFERGLFDTKPERLGKVERICLSHWGSKIVSAGEGDDTLN